VRRQLPGGFELDDDRARIDVDAVHLFLSTESYWGLGRPRERVARAIEGSTRVLGLYAGARSVGDGPVEIDRSKIGQQVGFARAVSDGVTVAYLADVYVLGAYRGRGLGLELVREILDGSFGEVRWMLHTADAEGLYAKLGFGMGEPPYPLMERGANARSSSRR
jgi:GNAT superfamily N-acetyltransferase